MTAPNRGKAALWWCHPISARTYWITWRSYVGEGKDSLLFTPAKGGCHLADTTFRPHFGAALDKIGRQGVRVHDLRHFAGTMTARVGTLRETMSRLGHSTVDASMLYQGLVNGRDVEIAEALSALATNDTP